MVVQFTGTNCGPAGGLTVCQTQPVLQFGIYNYPKDADAAPTAQAYNAAYNSIYNSNLQCLVNRLRGMLEKGRQDPNA